MKPSVIDCLFTLDSLETHTWKAFQNPNPPTPIIAKNKSLPPFQKDGQTLHKLLF
jgi:hypothetical protein